MPAGTELPPDAQMPEWVWPLFATEMVNRVLHANYTVDQVVEFDPWILQVIEAVGAVTAR